MVDVRPAGSDQPRRNHDAEPRGVAEAIGLAALVEVLYELPREVWGDDIQGAIDYAEPVPIAGDEAFIDDTNYPIFGAGEKAAE